MRCWIYCLKTKKIRLLQTEMNDLCVPHGEGYHFPFVGGPVLVQGQIHFLHYLSDGETWTRIALYNDCRLKTDGLCIKVNQAAARVSDQH